MMILHCFLSNPEQLRQKLPKLSLSLLSQFRIEDKLRWARVDMEKLVGLENIVTIQMKAVVNLP